MRHAAAPGLPALLLALLLAVAGGSGPAWAHAVLLDSEPPDGAVLDAPPSAVELRFNEPVRPLSLRLLALREQDGTGTVIADERTASVDGERLRLPFPAAAAGTERGSGYTVSFRVVSADGHPVAGSLVFQVGGGQTQSQFRPAVADGSLPERLLLVLLRALHWGTALAAAGGGLFLAFIDRERVLGRSGGRPLVLLAAMTAVSGVALLALLAEVARELAPAVLAATVGAGLAAFGAGRIRARPSAVAGAVLVALSFALSGHIANGPASVAAVVLHALAAAFWIGSLWPLLRLVRTVPPATAAQLVVRFSQAAGLAVAVLLAAGAVLSVLQLGSASAIAGTAYGAIWLVKLLLVGGLLAVATLNRFRLTPALAGGDAGRATAAARRLAGLLRLDLALAAGVVLATAAFTLTPPPRTAPPPPLLATAEMGGYRVQLTLAADGRSLALVPSFADGRPATVAEVMTEWSASAEGVEPLYRPLTRRADGTFAGDIGLPFAGVWQVRVDLLIDDFTKVVLRSELTLPSRR